MLGKGWKRCWGWPSPWCAVFTVISGYFAFYRPIIHITEGVFGRFSPLLLLFSGKSVFFRVIFEKVGNSGGKTEFLKGGKAKIAPFFNKTETETKNSPNFSEKHEKNSDGNIPLHFYLPQFPPFPPVLTPPGYIYPTRDSYFPVPHTSPSE